jgi:hypothetical protein
MAKTRRVIKDPEKSVSVSREQVEIVAKQIKATRPIGRASKARRRLKRRAPILRQMRSS